MLRKIMMISVVTFLVLTMTQYNNISIAEDKADMTTKGSSKMIENVGKLGWSIGKDDTFIGENTFIGALTVSMQNMGEKVTYDYLMGVSGAAFRLHFHQPKWCPSSPDATCGFDCSKLAMKALGYEAIIGFASKDKPEEMEKARSAIVQSINNGRPVPAIEMNDGNWEIIAGYQDDGKKFLRRNYFDNIDGYSQTENCPDISMIIGNKGSVPDQKESILKSLAIAIELANTEKYGNYYNGFAAYEKWASELVNDDLFSKVSVDELKTMNHTNGWCHDSLIDARRSASHYLKTISVKFNEESAKHLLKASEIYNEIVKKLVDGRKYAHWGLKEGEIWTKEERQSMANVLKEALALEKDAVNEIKAGLEIENANPSKAVILDNVDRYRIIDAMFEGVRVVLAYRGETYSPEYICGISGAAFRIAGICPCAPTCSGMMDTQSLPKLLGYEVEYIPLYGKDINPNDEVQKAIKRIKDEISAGRPVVVWHAFTNAEWDVVCGFNEDRKQFIGRGSYAGTQDYAVADETRTIKCTDLCDPLGIIIIGNKTGEFDARKAELEALKEAVKHAHTIKEIPADGKWVFLEGLQCYNRWVNDFQSDPKKKRGSGDSYCLGIYRSTHRAAGGFMKELMPKYPEAKENLEKASEYFVAEAIALDQCDSLIGWNTSEGPDADRNAKTAKLLEQARDNYSKAINEIEEALKKIGGKLSPESQR